MAAMVVVQTTNGKSGPKNQKQLSILSVRKHLAVREFEDLKLDRIITVQQFKQRVAQILHSYSLKGPGEEYPYLEKLVRGMPKRLERCRKNKFGPCGQ